MQRGCPKIIEAQTIIFPMRGPNLRSTFFDKVDRGIWPIMPRKAKILYVCSGTET